MANKTNKKNISATRPNRRVTPNTSGFSLVEILTVVMIIALLAAIGLGVGSKVLVAASNKKTAAHMQIIMHAINIYQEEVGNITSASEINGEDLFTALTKGDPNNDDYPAIWINDIKPIIDKLPDNAFAKDADGTATGFVDGFNELLVFDPDAGLGGTPRLMSGGQDKNPGTTDDNIYSDK